MRRRWGIALVVLAAANGRQPAFGQTQENLDRAVKLYENLETERARDMFLQVISPSSPFQVTQAQRVTAYTYLGASLATLGQVDSAQIYFRAAIERDPFVDLDPQKFSPQERQVFALAKRATFKTAARPLDRVTRIDPRTETIKFTVLTTHASRLLVEVNKADEDLRFPLYTGDNDGLREILWSGNQRGQQLVPPGPYELIVTGASLIDNTTRDSTRILFDIAHEFQPLEDTLRSFTPADTLPTRYPPSTARRDLVLGLMVAGAGVAVPFTVVNKSLDDSTTKLDKRLPIGVSGVTLLAGIGAYLSLSRHPEIPQNVRENARRRAARDSANAAIVARNNAKLAETKLVFTPVAAAGQ